MPDSFATRFYSRQKEVELFRRLCSQAFERQECRFVVLCGQRGVGKSWLLQEALAEFEGIPVIDCFLTAQLSVSNLVWFVDEIRSALHLSYRPAFRSFEEALSFVFEESRRRPLALVFHEFHLLQDIDPCVFEVLGKLWESDAGKAQLLIVACTSDAISTKELFKTSPLKAVAATWVDLKPFEPVLLKTILSETNPNFTGEDALALFALTGGVAHYVQVLLASQAFEKEAMLDEAADTSKALLAQAQLTIANTLKGNAATLNEILKAVAGGCTRRSDLVKRFSIDISGHLHQLENVYGWLKAVEPVGKNGAQRMRARYEVTEDLLDFWYTLILPNLKLLEAGKTTELNRAVKLAYSQWSESVLKCLYRRHFMSLGLFDTVGPWWDRKGENAIDLVAVDDSGKRIVFAEVKRSAEEIQLNALKERAAVFFEFNPYYKDCQKQYLGLTLAELSHTGQLPFIDEDPQD